MSRLQYFDYPGFGARVRKDTHYSQAVRIGDRIEISGQGGWDRITEKIPKDVAAEIDQVFDNVQATLQQAGGTGWDQVYRVRLYVCGDNTIEQNTHVVRNLKKWCPDHQPLLTGMIVKALAFEEMTVEIEVEAYLGD